MADPVIQVLQQTIEILEPYSILPADDPDYVNPANIYFPVRWAGSEKTYRMSLPALQSILNDEIINTIDNAFINGYYLNDGSPWADTAEVLATIDLADRTDYMVVNIMGVLYWFLPDHTTLVEVVDSISIPANSISLDKLIQFSQWTVLYRRTAGTGNMEANTLTQLGEDLGIPEIEADILELQGLIKQDVFTITLPSSGTVAGRVAAAVETTDYPTGWVLDEDVDDKDLSITHNLGRRIANVNVFQVDDGEERYLRDDLAYTGYVAKTDDRLVIEGLSTVGYPIVIQLIFA